MKKRMLSMILIALLVLHFQCALADAWGCPIHSDEFPDASFRQTWLNNDEHIIALRRGDTFIISIDDFILHASNYDSLHSTTKRRIYTIAQAAQLLQSMLIDTEYQRCKQEYAQSGGFDATAYTLYSIGKHGETSSEFDLNMNLRLVGSQWIAVVRPAESEGTALSTCFTSHQNALHMEDGVLDIEVTGCRSSYLYLEPTLLNDLQADFQMQWGKLSMEVYNLLDYLHMPVYIAVLRDAQGADRSLRNVNLQIGDTQRDSLSGYVDGADAIYCCILNEQEVQLLRDGTLFQLIH